MKKIISIILAICVAILTFSACSSNKDTASTEASGNINSDETASSDNTETEPFVYEGTNPLVTITMENGGVIIAELYPEIAPNTVYNFISLIQKGFYDGLIFHRVIPGMMIQGGDPNGTGTGGPGYVIKGEFTNNGFENNLKHERGVISMARRSSPLDSAGSQFFIMVDEYPSLDDNYAAFGKVLYGMDVADSIVSAQRDSSDKPFKAQVMKSVTVETFGITYPEPETLPSID